MTVVINGTTGITNDGGYTGDGVVFADTTPANTLVTTTGGNVGIGTSSPTDKLSLYSATSVYQRFQNSTTGTGAADGFQIGNDATNAYVWNFEATPIIFATSNAVRASITSSGNVGIGTASPGALLDVSAAGTAVAKLTNRNSGATEVVLSLDAGGNGVSVRDSQIRGGNSGGNLTYISFYTSAAATPVERARIDSSGKVLVGLTTAYGDGGIGTPVLQWVAKSGQFVGAVCSADTTSALGAIAFKNPNGVVGQISTSGSATSYVTSSDYRLKERIAPMTGALARVAALKPVTYKWKVDGSDGEGFIAHELQEIVPEAVVGEKDAVDADGNPRYQGIDTSFLVATLTAAIQEQQTIITKQTAQIQQLQEKVLEVEEGTSNMLVENTNNLHEIITALTARVAALEGTQP
jgi:uncharacterized coiled-coil protein SlyX